MKVRFLILLLILFSGTVQTEANNHSYSLKGEREINFPFKGASFFIVFPDTATISTLNNIALAKLNSNQPDSALFFSLKSLKLSEAIAYEEGKLSSMHILAKAQKQRNAYAEALNYYLQIESLLHIHNSDTGLFQIRVEIGALYEEWGVKEKAIDYYLKSYKTASPAQKVSLLEKVSACFLSINDYPNTIKYSLELLDIEKRNGNARAILDVLKKISNTFIQSGNHAEALKYELEILSLKETIQDEVEVANSLNNIGFLYKHLGNNDLALQYFKESLYFNRKLNPKGFPNVAEKKILMNISIIYHTLGDYRKSLKYQFEALQSWISQGDPVEIAEIYNKIAFNYLMLKDYDKAVNYAETALSLAEKGGDKLFLAQSYKAISELYHKTGDDRKALNIYQLYAKVNDELMVEQNKKQEELIQKQFIIERKENDLRHIMAEKEMRELELKKLQLEAEKNTKDIELLRREKELQEVSMKHQQSEKERVEQALALTRNQLEMEARDNKITLLKTNDSIQNLALKQKESEERERLKDIALLRQQKANQQMILEEQHTTRKIIYGVLLLMAVIICLVIKSYLIKKKAHQKLAEQNKEIQTQKDQIEQQKNGLEHAYNNIKLLSEMAKDINSNLSVEKIAEVVYTNINEMMDAASFGIGIYNEVLNRIEIPGAIENGKTIPKIFIPVAEENRLAIWSFKNKEVVFINDYEVEYKRFVKELPPAIVNQNSESIMYVPLMVKSKCIGILTVQSFKKNAYSEFHLNLLLNLAVYIAIAVENARAYQLIEERTEALERTLAELREAQVQLIHAEKMASLGHLTAGIAHEINNPINFVYAGADAMSASMEDLLKVLKRYEDLDHACGTEDIEATVQSIKALKEQLRFEKTTTSIYKVVNAIKEGAGRTAEIVKGLRYFSRLNESELKLADIHDGIDNTLIILSSKIKQKEVKVNKIYDTKLPELKCYPGQLNQVFMNIISNAIEAVTDNGVITIKTINQTSEALISISDTGKGIPDIIKPRIFEPFFTTKELGQGTGLGLSISYGIIEKHEGKIQVNSRKDKGSEFIISLPKSLGHFQKFAS